MIFRKWTGFLFLGLAACSDDTRMADAAFQYRVDSTVNARLDSAQTVLQKRNDSLILQAAQLRADSIRRASGKLPASRVRTDTGRPTVVIPEVGPPNTPD